MIIQTRSVENPYCTRTVAFLRGGARRFHEIEKHLDIRRPAALSDLLKKMERDGLLTRHMIIIGPPARVEYVLTPLGKSLANPASAMIEWIDKHHGDVERARERHSVEAEASRANATSTI
jgi:DNA-binding HxlR family transcriptional regulator